MSQGLESSIGRGAAKARAASATARSGSRGAWDLSTRERQILSLMAAGRSNEEIAQDLFISRKTVEAHVAHIFDKLEVTTRLEAVIVAVRLPPMDPDQIEVGALLDEANLNVPTDTFLEDVREALESIRRPGPVLLPESQFTSSEVDALTEGGFELVRSGTGDPMAEAAAAFTALLASSLDVAGASRLLEVSPTRIRQMLGQRSLYGIRTGPTWRIPTFQFSDRGLIPGLSDVIRRLPTDLHPLAVERWLTSPDPDLEMGEQVVSPLAWLRSGADPSRAADIAAEL